MNLGLQIWMISCREQKAPGAWTQHATKADVEKSSKHKEAMLKSFGGSGVGGAVKGLHQSHL